MTKPVRQLAVARETLDRLAPSARRAIPAEAVRRAHALVTGGDRASAENSGLPATRTVYVVSDFQAADWSPADSGLRKSIGELLGDRAQPEIVAVMCSSGETRNNCVTGLSRAGRIIKVDSPARIVGRLRRRGARGEEAGDGAAELSATLEVDGSRADSRSTGLKPDQAKDVVFFASFEREGDHGVVLRTPADTCPADDVRYLALEAREEVRVLVLDGDPRDREPFLSESFYLRFALKPGDKALSPIETKVVDVDTFGSEKLKDYDLVVLANVDALPVTAVRDVSAYVRGGGALMVFLGAQVDTAAYNSGLFGGADSLLRLRLGERVSPPGKEGFKVAMADLAGPVMKLFKKGGSGISTARFNRAYEIDLSAAPQAAVHARLSPGKHPLVVGADVGEGRAVLINTSADLEWSSLPIKPAFTAMLQRMVVWLLEPRSRCQNLAPGDTYRLVLPLGLIGRNITFRTPGGRTYVRQPVAGDGQSRRATVKFEMTEEPGFYQVSWEGLEGSKEGRLFSVNVAVEESDLASIEAPAFKELAGGRGADWVEATQAVGFEAQSGGREYWKWIFLLAVLVLATETYLSRRFSGGDR